MFNKLVLAGVLSISIVSLADAQVAQAMSAHVSSESGIQTIGTLVTATPGSTTSGTKWLDTRCDFMTSVHQWMDGIPTTQQATHAIQGRIRVKWVGGSPPNPATLYSATFAAWSLRNGNTSTALTRSTPGARSFQIDTAVTGTFSLITTLNLQASTSSPGSSGVIYQGDLSGTGNIFSEALPSIGSNGNWAAQPDYTAVGGGVFFAQEPDGFYYGDVHVGTNVYVTSTFSGNAPSGWHSLDNAGAMVHTRVVFLLKEVDGQAVL